MLSILVITMRHAIMYDNNYALARIYDNTAAAIYINIITILTNALCDQIDKKASRRLFQRARCRIVFELLAYEPTATDNRIVVCQTRNRDRRRDRIENTFLREVKKIKYAPIVIVSDRGV